jgi:hypothetical protein
MNHREFWFVGLLALAYIYLDGSALAAQREDMVASPGPLPDDPAPPVLPRVTDACPRDLSHRISLRRDGALWCIACDEGFYPVGLLI